MKARFIDEMGCIPPVLPVTDDGPEHKKCPLYHLIDDEDRVTTKHIFKEF